MRPSNSYNSLRGCRGPAQQNTQAQNPWAVRSSTKEMILSLWWHNWTCFSIKTIQVIFFLNRIQGWFQQSVSLGSFWWKSKQKQNFSRKGKCDTAFPFYSFFLFFPLRTSCLLPAVSVSLNDLSGGRRFCFCSALHVVLMMRAPEPEKASLESEHQSERVSDFNIPSLSGSLVHHSPSTLTSSSLPLTGRWYRAQSVLHADRRRHWSTGCGTFKLIMPHYVRFLLLLLCLILIGDCRKHKSRKKRWSAPAETHKPGT